MPVETVYAASVAVNTGLLTPANALGAPNGTFTSNSDGAAWEADFNMQPTQYSVIQPGETHSVAVTWRLSGTLDSVPSFEIWVGSAGTGYVNIGTFTPSTTSGVAQYNFTDAQLSGITQAANVRVRLDDRGTGGPPASRRSVQVDAVELNLFTILEATPLDPAAFDTNLTATAAQPGRTTFGDANSVSPFVVSAPILLEQFTQAAATTTSTVGATSLRIANASAATTTTTTVTAVPSVSAIADIVSTSLSTADAVAFKPASAGAVSQHTVTANLEFLVFRIIADTFVAQHTATAGATQGRFVSASALVSTAASAEGIKTEFLQASVVSTHGSTASGVITRLAVATVNTAALTGAQATATRFAVSAPNSASAVTAAANVTLQAIRADVVSVSTIPPPVTGGSFRILADIVTVHSATGLLADNIESSMTTSATVQGVLRRIEFVTSNATTTAQLQATARDDFEPLPGRSDIDVTVRSYRQPLFAGTDINGTVKYITTVDASTQTVGGKAITVQATASTGSAYTTGPANPGRIVVEVHT